MILLLAFASNNDDDDVQLAFGYKKLPKNLKNKIKKRRRSEAAEKKRVQTKLFTLSLCFLLLSRRPVFMVCVCVCVRELLSDIFMRMLNVGGVVEQQKQHQQQQQQQKKDNGA